MRAFSTSGESKKWWAVVAANKKMKPRKTEARINLTVKVTLWLGPFAEEEWGLEKKDWRNKRAMGKA